MPETANTPLVAASLQECLARFLDPRGSVRIKFGLDRMKAALAQLDNPQNRIAPAFHIAGTNGKGSVASFIHHVASAADLTAHVFTSPHLVRVNERIRVSGELVSDDTLIAALEQVHDAGPDLTYFEALSAAAFLIFSRQNADISVIEVGAGGDLDSTNVMDKPAACIITQVARDHEKLFGTSDIAGIAAIKAGIMRPDTPVVISEQTDDLALGVLLDRAEACDGKVYLAGRDWHSRWEGDAFVYEDNFGTVRSPWLGLSGHHQRVNAGAACAALRLAGVVRHDTEDISAGLRETRWPGRMQTLGPGPLTEENDLQIIIDGAHNPAAITALADSLSGLTAGGLTPKPAIIFAAQTTKDVKEMLSILALQAAFFIFCPLSSGHQEGGDGVAPTELARHIEAGGGHAMLAENLREAVQIAAASDAEQAIVCGSLYLVGEALELNNEAPT